jgi:outer membrane protein
MKLTRVCSLMAAAVLLSAAALAQTDGAPSPTPGLPAAPSSAGASTATLGTSATGSKIGAINVEQAIFASNEGQRDFDVLSKKLEPKQTDLKGKNDEIEALKKQLNTQGDKMNDEAKANLQRQVEQKQKALERSAQDAQEDARNQENEIAQRILQKMAPLIVKYASDNGFGMIIDTSTNNQWPNGPVLWHGPALDITKPVVDAYNAQSGIAPPPPRQGGASGATGARPSGAGTSKPTAPATKSAAPATSKPQGTTTTPPSK